MKVFIRVRPVFNEAVADSELLNVDNIVKMKHVDSDKGKTEISLANGEKMVVIQSEGDLLERIERESRIAYRNLRPPTGFAPG